MKSLRRIAFAITLLAAALPANSQSLQVLVSTASGSSAVLSGGSVTLLPPDVGQASLASVSIRNISSADVSITGITIAGATDIALLLAAAFPITLTPNATGTFGIQYQPTSASAATAQVSIASTSKDQQSLFTFLVTAGTARLTYSYSTAGGAATDVAAGGVISFPQTNLGASVTAIVTVQNRGSAAATLQSVSVTGAGYQLSPAFSGPVQLVPGAQTTVAVIYTPPSAGVGQGALIFSLSTGAASFTLSGTGATNSFVVGYSFADGNVHALTDGAALTFPGVDVNSAGTASIEIQNQGTGSGVVNSVSLNGAMFRFASLPLLPATVAGGQTLRFGIVFAPTRPGTYTGSFSINLGGRTIAGTLTASTASSNISLSYIDPSTNNILPLQDGATMSFPTTAVGSSSTVTLIAANRGPGSGAIDSIALSTTPPSAFQLQDLPLFPATLTASQQVRFGVRFAPPQQQAFSAQLIVSINGQSATFTLRAQGSAPQFTYRHGAGGASTMPGGAIPAGDVNVGQTAKVAISVGNVGDATGQISTLAVTGSGYSLSDLPPLPITLRPNASQTFTLNFTPTEPGPATGRLTIGNESFVVTGSGVGARLIYSYTTTAPAVAVAEGGVVIFPPLEVGAVERMQFSMRNTGTSAATISSINLATPSAAFALEQLPPLPLRLDAGASVTFGIAFNPNNTGALTATLQVNTGAFTLSGSGTQPDSLPAYQFQTPAVIAQPAQQPAVGLTLAAPYPVTLHGVLKLSFLSSVFTDDPAIQFATGGRTIAFTIPAKSTEALFFNNSQTIALQTGTTAGSIVLTPSFAMLGGFDLTPVTPDTLTIPIPRTAPQLLGASVTAQTGTSFSVLLTGYSTTRSIRHFEVQFTPKQGESFSTSRLIFDVAAASAAWFQSEASQNTGGSFAVSIPFVLQNGSAAEDLVHRLASLTITATNEVGVSGAVTVPIP